MTCRHKKGDPACTSGNSPEDLFKKGQQLVREWGPKMLIPGMDYPTVSDTPNAIRLKSAKILKTLETTEDGSPPTPDCEQFQILEATMANNAMVLRVQYPSCDKCAYEGTKVLVYKGVTPMDALLWKRIDPHFSDPTEKRERHEAPPPIARFPADIIGWRDALRYGATVKEDE